MNIVFDARTITPHFPGIGRYVHNLARALPEFLNENEHMAILYDSSHIPSWLHKEREKIASRASPFSLAQQWQIPSILRQVRADAYHSPYYLMPYYPGVPTILTVHDTTAIHYPQTVSRRARLFFRLTSSLALRTANTIIAISKTTQMDFVKAFNVPQQRIHIVYEAAEAHFRPQSTSEVTRVREKYSLPETFALYFGINKPHKNLPRLIQAWKGINPTGWSLVIAGAWDKRYPQAKEEAAGTESIFFLGPIPEEDLPSLYTAASLFIFPSIYEGFGLPVLEAMSCGTPVICANTSSLPEVGGNAVLYFDPLSVETIGNALQEAIANSNLRQELSTRGLEQATHFSWQRTAQETLKLYRLNSP